jgi:transposase
VISRSVARVGRASVAALLPWSLPVLAALVCVLCVWVAYLSTPPTDAIFIDWTTYALATQRVFAGESLYLPLQLAGPYLLPAITPEGYIYPKQERALRDLLRKRGQLVHQRTANLLSIQSLISRTTGNSISATYIKALNIEHVDGVLPNADLVLALKANLAVMNSADAQIEILEKAVQDRVKLRPQFRLLKTVPGIGPILALTIMLETGAIERFASVGNYASYCRCVGSKKISNGKRKGSGNTKNGNKYLAWAFVEAANFAIRFNPKIKSFYQKKKSKSNAIVAIKAVAHKLCRACYYIIKDQVAFDITKAFA